MTISQSLGLLVLSGRERPDLDTAVGLAKAALTQGIEVKIFLMGDGVFHLEIPQLKGLIDDGAKVTFCAQNVLERGFELQADTASVVGDGSQYDLACIVADSDRFVAFT